MTYRSLIVEEHETRESATAVFVAGGHYKIFALLNAFTWPSPAWAFARDNDLSTDYVDNCWLRVALDAHTLRGFLALGAKTELNIGELIDRVENGHWYVINEEEF